jgi:SAM-dependent methyltransferase
MKIRTDDIYRVQNVKYKYASEFVSGKVLDITYGKYLDYSKSQLLLKKGAKEVWSLDLLDPDQYVILRKLDKDKIVYERKNKNELDSINFDAILAFNIFSILDNAEDYLKFISEHLKNNGVSLISIVNDDGYLDKPHDLLTKDLILFSKTDFEKNLKIYFNNISFFSQGIVIEKEVSEPKIKNTLKIKLRNFFLGSVKRLNFYIKYIQPIQNSFVKSKKNIENKKTQKYEITSYNEETQSMFTIAVCKNT